MKRIVRLDPDRRFEILEAEGELLTAMQTAVQGYIEHVHVPKLEESGIDMWCNEEGLYGPAEYNPLASYIAETRIVGPVVFTGTADSEGNTKGLKPVLIGGLVALMLLGQDGV